MVKSPRNMLAVYLNEAPTERVEEVLGDYGSWEFANWQLRHVVVLVTTELQAIALKLAFPEEFCGAYVCRRG